MIELDGYTDRIDCGTRMRGLCYGCEPSAVIVPTETIKITTPDDFYTFRALYDARENQQLMGGYKL